MECFDCGRKVKAKKVREDNFITIGLNVAMTVCEEKIFLCDDCRKKLIHKIQIKRQHEGTKCFRCRGKIEGLGVPVVIKTEDREVIKNFVFESRVIFCHDCFEKNIGKMTIKDGNYILATNKWGGV